MHAQHRSSHCGQVFRIGLIRLLLPLLFGLIVIPAEAGEIIEAWSLNTRNGPLEPAATDLLKAILQNDVVAINRLVTLEPQLIQVRYDGAYEDTPYSALPLTNMTPLHFAAMAGHREASTELVKLGANVHAMDADGREPLTYAILGQTNIHVMELLLQSGADVNHADHAGKTALMNYGFYNHANLTDLDWLLEHGADPGCRSRSGETVWTPFIERGLSSEFLDWDWRDQPQWAMVQHIYPYAFHIPGLVQFLALVLLLGGCTVQLRGYSAGTVLPENVRRKFARWDNLPACAEALPAVQGLYLRRQRLMRWIWLALLAGEVVVTGILADSLLMELAYIKPLLGFALLYACLYALLYAPWSVTKLAAAVGLLGLTMLGVPVLGYHGLLMFLHLNEVFVCAVYFLTTLVFVVQTALLWQLAWLNGRIWRGERQLNRAAADNLKAQENTGIDTPPGWDEVKR